jgi:hypothetical protein
MQPQCGYTYIFFLSEKATGKSAPLQGHTSQRQRNSPSVELCYEASDLALLSILIDTKSLPGQ